MSIAKSFEEAHPAINIFLDRGDMEYQDGGRYEDYEAAVEMDHKIRAFMDEHLDGYVVFNPRNRDDIIKYIDVAVVESALQKLSSQ